MRTAALADSFADRILHHARLRPEKPAIILSDRVATYGMLAQGILRVENRLRTQNFASGAVIAIAVENPIRHITLAAALYRLGHPSLSIRRIEDVLPLDLPITAFLHAANEKLHVGQRQIFVGDDWFEGGDRPITAAPAAGFTDERSVCRIELSSGTTGRRKAVSLSVAAVYQWLTNYYPAIGLGLWDRLLSLPGLNSSWGFTLAAHALYAGKTLAFAQSARDALNMIAVYGIDAVAASTQQLSEIVREQTQAPVSCATLRAVHTGGSLLSRALMHDAGTKLCNAIVNQYGSTEAGATAFATIDRLIDIEGATGYIAPWAQVEVVDESDNRLPAGVAGILRIRSSCQAEPFPPGRADGHAGFRDGWFYPGDRGHVTADGLLVLSGRTSGVINVGGVKIAPEVVEETLRLHPTVAEAVAIGKAGADGIEQIIAIIVPRPPCNEQAIIDWCAQHGVPVARVIVVDALPKTESGKIHRHLVVQQYGG